MIPTRHSGCSPRGVLLVVAWDTAETDADGRFRIPASPGTRLTAAVLDLAGQELARTDLEADRERGHRLR